MIKLTRHELHAEIYAVLRLYPLGDDLHVAAACAAAVLNAEDHKERHDLHLLDLDAALD